MYHFQIKEERGNSYLTMYITGTTLWYIAPEPDAFECERTGGKQL